MTARGARVQKKLPGLRGPAIFICKNHHLLLAGGFHYSVCKMKGLIQFVHIPDED